MPVEQRRIEGDPEVRHPDASFAEAVRRYLTEYRRGDLWELRYLVGRGYDAQAIFGAAARLRERRKGNQAAPSMHAVRLALEGDDGHRD